MKELPFYETKMASHVMALEMAIEKELGARREILQISPQHFNTHFLPLSHPLSPTSEPSSSDLHLILHHRNTTRKRLLAAANKLTNPSLTAHREVIPKEVALQRELAVRRLAEGDGIGPSESASLLLQRRAAVAGLHAQESSDQLKRPHPERNSHGNAIAPRLISVGHEPLVMGPGNLPVNRESSNDRLGKSALVDVPRKKRSFNRTQVERGVVRLCGKLTEKSSLYQVLPLKRDANGTKREAVGKGHVAYPSMASTFSQEQTSSQHRGKQSDGDLSSSIQKQENQNQQLYCNVCQVPCMDAFNLHQHRLGKKHQAQCSALQGSNKDSMTYWCELCQVPCSGMTSWVQHNAGKKHKAQLATRAEPKSKDEPGSKEVTPSTMERPKRTVQLPLRFRT